MRSDGRHCLWAAESGGFNGQTQESFNRVALFNLLGQRGNSGVVCVTLELDHWIAGMRYTVRSRGY